MKTKVTFLLDKDLHQVIKMYAKQQHRSVTQVFVDFILSLQKEDSSRETGKTQAGTSVRLV